MHCKRCKSNLIGHERTDGYCSKCMVVINPDKFVLVSPQQFNNHLPPGKPNSHSKVGAVCGVCGIMNKPKKLHKGVCKKCRKGNRGLERTPKRRTGKVSASYLEYLNSPEWEVRRKITYEYWGGRCAACYSDGLVDAHHRTYKRFKNELDTDLILLCRTCHKKFHGKDEEQPA